VNRDFDSVMPLDNLISLRHTLTPDSSMILESQKKSTTSSSLQKPDALRPVRDWLDHLEIHDPKLARFLCKLIPAQCPFERDVKLFGRKVVHIPPMCKINPLYEQLVGIRFRALCYLADVCGEDITRFC